MRARDERTLAHLRALEPHAKKVYGHLAAHPAKPGAVRIARWIRKARIEGFRPRAVRRKGWAEFTRERDAILIADALNLLEAYGWVQFVEQSPGMKGGRPTSSSYIRQPVE